MPNPKQSRERAGYGVGLEVTGRYRYPSPDPSWLARRIEPVLEPDLPIIDAHHHLWIENDAPYLLGELAGDIGDGHRIAATVFVQGHYGYRDDGAEWLRPVGETEKVTAIARAATDRGMRTQVAAGIVAFADLTLGARVEDVLTAHEAAAEGRLRGIRHSVSRDENFPDGIVLRPAPAGLLADADYRAGLAKVAARGLCYDAMLYHRQLPELTALARALPRLPIVLDHAGCVLGIGPYQQDRAATFAQWRADMAELARCPNVTVKIGGFGMIITGARWHEHAEPPGFQELADAWRPQVESCIELFGAERCMFESNFPVDKAMTSYRTLWNAFKHLTAGASADERHALFGGTATRVYRLDPALLRQASDG